MRNLAVILLLSGGILAACAPNPGVQPITSPLAPTPTATQSPETPVPTEDVLPAPVLATPQSDSPAAGICDFDPGELIAFEIYPDIPSPRCARATGEQHLQVINRTDQDLIFWIGPYEYTLEPGANQVVDAEFGTYLAPGVHCVCTTAYGGNGGPELWLVTEP